MLRNRSMNLDVETLQCNVSTRILKLRKIITLATSVYLTQKLKYWLFFQKALTQTKYKKIHLWYFHPRSDRSKHRNPHEARYTQLQNQNQ